MVLRVACVVVLLGCGSEEEPPRQVSKAEYPEEYATAICSIQLECTSTDVTQAECEELTESSVRSKLERNCFDEDFAVACLDILEEMTCNEYEENIWSICGDVDDCSQI